MSEPHNPIDPNEQPTEPAKPQELGKDELERLRQLMREPPSDNNGLESSDSDSPQTADFNATAPKRSRYVGKYKLLQRIGEGGMHAVYG